MNLQKYVQNALKSLRYRMRTEKQNQKGKEGEQFLVRVFDTITFSAIPYKVA